ncbi:hypothetical protein QCD61_19330 [Pseudomonas viciae]|uniref:Uncharacterized protein n=1 Tax=Pseudomonas viciae TaxID=2505979 RepID=A0ABY8P9G0_9PSED|nr:hypothetical protein [Pseudomonas viciae]WGO91850.1 hypothetical protein QCD61_19330 [Pseudomonas viciae]
MSEFIPLPTPHDFDILHEDFCIQHPVTGLDSYGFVPQMKSQNIVLPAGEIYLRAGKHIGPNQGFGVRHIWTQHGHELPRYGCKAIHDVATYVSSIIVQGAPIFCEFHQRAGGYRLTVLRSSKGCVILAPFLAIPSEPESNFYSVVTAYKHQRVHGTQVGKVQTKKAPDP